MPLDESLLEPIDAPPSGGVDVSLLEPLDPLAGHPIFKLADRFVPNRELYSPFQALKQAAVKGVGETAMGAAGVANDLAVAGLMQDESLDPTERMRMIDEINRKNETPAKRLETTRAMPLYQWGKGVSEAAAETYPIDEKDKEAGMTKVGETIGSYLPMMAAGPLAPAQIGLQSAGGHLENDFERLKSTGLSAEDAAKKTIDNATVSGLSQASIFLLLPKPLRKFGDKYIIDKLAPEVGEKTITRFLAGRAAMATEMGTLLPVAHVAENIINDRPIFEGVPQTALSGVVMGPLLPHGDTESEQEQKAAFGESNVAKLPAPDQLMRLNYQRSPYKQAVDELRQRSGNLILKAKQLRRDGGNTNRRLAEGMERDSQDLNNQAISLENDYQRQFYKARLVGDSGGETANIPGVGGRFVIPTIPPLPTTPPPFIPKPVEPQPPTTGEPNAISIRSPAPPVVGETPGGGAEVGGQIRNAQTPALPQANLEGPVPETPGAVAGQKVKLSGLDFDKAAARLRAGEVIPFSEVDAVPYLADQLARGGFVRDLPGKQWKFVETQAAPKPDQLAVQTALDKAARGEPLTPDEQAAVEANKKTSTDMAAQMAKALGVELPKPAPIPAQPPVQKYRRKGNPFETFTIEKKLGTEKLLPQEIADGFEEVELRNTKTGRLVDKNGDRYTAQIKQLEPVVEKPQPDAAKKTGKFTVAEKLKAMGYTQAQIDAMDRAGAKALAERGGKKRRVKLPVTEAVKPVEAGVDAEIPKRSNVTVPTDTKSVARGVSRRKIFDRETELGGEDILSWMKDNMRMMSKTEARAARGKEGWKLIQNEYDGAAPLRRPHHNLIYGGKSKPDQVAQAAYEAGRLSAPDVNELWAAIHKASATRAGAFTAEKAEAKFWDEQAAEHEAWLKATAEGETRKTADQLKVGDLMEVDGERVEVTEVDADTGEITLKDGKKFGVQKLQEGQTIHVEKFVEAKEEEWPVAALPVAEPEPSASPAEPKPAVAEGKPVETPAYRIGQLIFRNDVNYKIVSFDKADGHPLVEEVGTPTALRAEDLGLTEETLRAEFAENGKTEFGETLEEFMARKYCL